MPDEYRDVQEGGVTKARKGIWNAIMRAGDNFLDWLEDRLKIIIREKDLFLGTFLFLIGFLDFRSGKYCDGNTADYLSCTRPVTYYYYTWLEIILIILGVFLILLWFLRREKR